MSDLTKHTTAQVVAALSKHYDWTAEAPETGELRAAKCDSNSSRRIYFWFRSNEFNDWDMDRAPDIRPDWTIRRPDGSIVERKPKRKRVCCGVTSIIKPGFWGFSKTHKKGFGNLDPSKSYKMICIEKP